MMGMPGIVELLIVVLFVVLFAVLFGGAARGMRRPHLGHVTLNCPHCGAETRADLPTCQHCERDL